MNSLVYAGGYALSSMCNACLGTTAPGTTGRKRSVLLLTLSILIALWFQYSLGPAIVNQTGQLWKLYSWLPGLGKVIYHAWYEPCAEQYTTNLDPNNNDTNMHLLEQCAGNAGVYRSMGIATSFFLVSAFATKIRPSLNKEAWPAKITVRKTFFHTTFFFADFSIVRW